MTRLGRILNTIGFLAAGACLILPFLHFGQGSEQGRYDISWNGWDLVVGGTPEVDFEQLMWSETAQAYELQEMPPEVLLMWVGDEQTFQVSGSAVLNLAVVLISAGALAAFLATPRSQRILALCAGLGAAATLAFGLWQAAANMHQKWPTAPLRLGYGAWLTGGLVLLLAALNVAAAIRARPAASAPADSTT
ncbi:hypothetical protein [Catellatospora sichuanensis]|uniref:hypothetical protein n=1 Tax=Catellatospora sichuanensis TaxID=1969805 RepID=UPI0011823B4B|nr:hypothetical protein [Catellatospora sichuanensis]